MRVFRLKPEYLFVTLIFWSACSSMQFQKDSESYNELIERLQTRIALDSNDWEAYRQLGVLQFKTADYEAAELSLQKAHRINAGDPGTLFYLGMTLEFLGEIEDAHEIARKYRNVPKSSKYRKLMAGRFQRLTRLLIRDEVQTLISREQQLRDSRMNAKTVAIFPLQYQGVDKKYSSVGRGMSEMMIIDLGKVKQLKLLERIRLQTLLDELQLAQSELVQQNSAPRIGKLLGAGRIVAGTFDVASDKLSVDVLSWDTINQVYPEGVSKSDNLDNLFRLEKDIVFGLVDELGIKLTPEEIQEISHVPTKNLQAFLAYSQGLEQQDNGNFAGAMQLFQQASLLDPGFSEAQVQSEETEGAVTAGGSPETVAADIASAEESGQPGEAGGEDLVRNRLRTLNNSIGSNFVPGQDNREGTEDAADSEADFGELAEPPPPPPQ